MPIHLYIKRKKKKKGGPHTWKALLSRKTRSYASFGGKRFKASMTVLDSSGMRSSALLFAKIYEQSRGFVYFLCFWEWSQFDDGGHDEKRGKRALKLWLRDLVCVYLNPSFLYPAASAYQWAKGVIHLFSQGLLVINWVSEGADMEALGRGCVQCLIERLLLLRMYRGSR